MQELKLRTTVLLVSGLSGCPVPALELQRVLTSSWELMRREVTPVV
jgi:hypothetical protein